MHTLLSRLRSHAARHWRGVFLAATALAALYAVLACTGSLSATQPGVLAAAAPTGAALTEPASSPTAPPTSQPTPDLRLPTVTALPITLPHSTLPPATPTPTATPTATPTVTLTVTPTATEPITGATLTLQPTPDGQERTAHVPILMYHYLSTPPADADAYRTDLSVPPDLFAAHLNRLQAEGYTTISLYDLLMHLTQGAPLPPKPVVITFDDGYRDNYANAFPLLKQRGMQATFFVITDFMDENRPEYLTWEMARKMLAAGMSIESHSRNHASLEGKDTDYLVWQALGSLETIQYELGVRPRFISYPAGDYDQHTIDVFKSANYWAGVTTEQGATQSSTDPFELQRIRVRNTTTPDKLIELMQADW